MTHFFSTPRLLSNLATLVAVGVLGLLCVRLVIQLSQEDSIRPIRPDAVPVEEIEEKTIDYSQLSQFNLFGKVKTSPKEEKRASPIKAPDTRLKLVLMGIFHSTLSDEGYAIISEQGKPQKTYQNGDPLPGNAKLFAVEEDRVILERNGRYESLSLLKLSEQKAKRLKSRGTSPAMRPTAKVR